MGSFLSFVSFLIVVFFYEEIDTEAHEFELGEINVILEGRKYTFCQTLREVLTDVAYWKYFGFSLITMGTKQIFLVLPLVAPKLLLI